MKIDRVISEGKDVYEASRKAWRLRVSEANRTSYLLGIKHGVIDEVYEGEWTDFDEVKGRTGLIDGKPTPEKIRTYYKGKRLPQWDTKWLVAQ